MKTRSQTKVSELQEKEIKKNSAVLYEVIIDFDEASDAWKKNKKSIGNGQYKYICPHEKNVDTSCGKVCYKGSGFCWAHRNK